MAPMMKDNRGLFAGVGVITLAVIVTASILAVVVNNRCSNSFWTEVTVYPGAEIQEEEAVFLGVQRAVYHSDDAPETIANWYQAQHVAKMRDAVTSGDFTQTRADATDASNRTITPDTTNGGSLITFAATCP